MADLIVTMLLLLAVSRGLGELFERMRQSPVVGEVLAGILLGPYLLKVAVLDAEGLSALQAVADLGVFLLVFLAGLEMDIEEIGHAVRGRGVLVGLLGFLLPFLGGVGLGTFALLPLEGALFLGLALGLTALPVSVRILMDLGLTEHSIGKVVISAAILTEVVTLTLLGVIIAFQDQAPGDLQEGLYLGTLTVVKTLLLFSFVLTVVQVIRLTTGVVPGAQRAFRRTLGVLRGRESLFALSILFVLTFAGVSQVLGLHFVVGAFFGGLLLTGRLLGEYNYKQVYKTTSAITFGFLAPIFFGFIGLQFVPDALLVEPVLAALVLGVGFSSKLLGGFIGARAAGRSSAEGMAVGFGIMIHGVLELVIANLALHLGIFTVELFSIVVLLSVVSTVLAPPLLRWSTRRIPKEKAAADGEGAGAKQPSIPRPDVLPAPEAPIIIVGGGRVAMELARAIGRCTIVERDEEQARAIASSLTEARVIIGSATDEQSLRRAGLRAGAVVLAVTDSDAANEAVVRLARKEGARRIIARTEQTGEVERLRQLGADAVLNSAEETASAILLELYPPDATMTEIVVPKGSPAVGKHLMELKLPRGTVVRSVSRRARVIVPTPDLMIEPRDNVIVSGSPQGLQAARNVLLGPRSGGESVNVLAAVPADEEAAQLLAREAGAIARLSRGAVVAAVPWESPSGSFAPKVEEVFRTAGAEAEVARGYGVTPADLMDALASARTPAPDHDAPRPATGDGRALDVAAPAAPVGHEVWVVALPKQAIGKAGGQIAPRRLPNLPSALGAPIYIARTGRAARTVTALIDGAEGADRAGTLACDIARILNARFVLLVVRHEDEPEPLEQAVFIEAYARNAGIGAVERQEVEHGSAPVVERQIRRAPDLVVLPAMPRAVRGRFIAQLASTGEHSVLLV